MQTLFKIPTYLGRVVFFIAFTCVVGFAQQPSTRAGDNGSAWVEHKSTEGRYTVWFPNEPKTDSKDATAPDGTVVKQHFTSASTEGAYFSISYFDIGGREFSLDKARDGMVNAVKGTLLSEEKITLNGNPGRQMVVFSKLNSGVELSARARMFLVGSRVYVLQHIYFKDAAPAAVDADSRRFLDSFALTPQ